jgi:hypothetical protein
LFRFLDHPPDNEFSERGFVLLGDTSQERHKAWLVYPFDHGFRIGEKPIGVLTPNARIVKSGLCHERLVLADGRHVPGPLEIAEVDGESLQRHRLLNDREKVGAVAVSGEVEPQDTATVQSASDVV